MTLTIHSYKNQKKYFTMKNFLFSLIFVFLSCSLWAQQQTDVLQQMEHKMYNDPLMERHANPDQDMVLSGEMDFLIPNIQNAETVILVDSVFAFTDIGNYKITITHDNNGNMLTYLNQYWYDAWVNDMLGTYTYDTNGSLLTSVFKEWSIDKWVNHRLYEYTYDSNGNKLSYLRNNWENGEWINSSLFSFTYDSVGNMITELYQYLENNKWENFNQYTYTYDTNRNFLTRLFQDWDNNYWKNKQLYTRTYNNNGNNLTTLVKDWKNTEWVNKWIYKNTYDNNGNMQTCLTQNWEIDNWVNNKLYSHIYDNNGNLLTEFRQPWENDEWVNEDKYEYIFIQGKVNATAYKWDEDNWVESFYNAFLYITMGGKYVYDHFAFNLELYYTDFTGIEDPHTNPENSPILCYPNPVTDQINIEIDPIWQAKNYRLELFSQTGQKVRSFEISSNIGSSIAPIEVGDVPPGLYLLRIEAGKHIFSQKIIISK